MFGLFKQKVTPAEFGNGLFQTSQDWLFADAGRSLGSHFDDVDASAGWSVFLERKGMPIPTQLLYVRRFTHCAVQAAGTQFDEGTRREMTKGAMSRFNGFDGNDFRTTYDTVEAVYRGQHKFDLNIEQLSNRDCQLTFLPNTNVGVLNAKYLIESFIIPNMENRMAYIDNFLLYSSSVCVPIAMLQRAITHLFKSLKIA